MMNHLPTLPPAFLERCLALSEQLFAMKSGAAKLEISPSHFVFSVSHFPGVKETGPTFRKTNDFKRKKTPSDMRRNAARMAQHLKNKNLAKSSTIPSSTEAPLVDPSTLIPPTSTEESTPTPTKEDSSETAKESSPSKTTPRTNPPGSTEASEIEADMEVDQPPPFIPSQVQPKKDVPVNESRNSPAQPEELHQVQIMICARNKTAAIRRSEQFPNFSDITAHESDKKHHFYFSIQANSEYVSKLKTNVNKFEDLMLFHVTGEDEKFQPDEDDPHHCQKCKNHGFYSKWLAAKAEEHCS